MPDRALIDTGALLAVMDPRDQFHQRAVANGRRFLSAGGRWVGSTFVLDELHGHVLQRVGASSARKHLARLLDDPAYEWLESVPGAESGKRPRAGSTASTISDSL